MAFPYLFIDLTHPLEATIPTWDGGCGFLHEPLHDDASAQNDHTFRVMNLNMQAGVGTHMDAPFHLIESGKRIHDFDVNELCMPCAVIDVSAKSHERYSLTPRDILDFEHKHGSLIQGSCVLINTGWSKFWTTPLKYRNDLLFPSVSKEAAKLLLKRNVSALGIDTLSPDRPADGFNVHQAFLSAGKLLIENVAHLDKMPPIGSDVLILPILIKEGTEAPVRLVGLIKKSA